MLDAVFFDFDGVLVDSVHIKEQAFGQLYEEYGDDVVEKVRTHHRTHGGISRFEKFHHYHSVFLQKEITAEEQEYLSQRFSDLVKKLVINADEITHADQVLTMLCQKLPLHVISATPEIELDEIINARQMRHFFRSTHGSPLKKAQHISALLQQQCYDKNKVVLIGDTISDYQAAMASEVHFIGYAPEPDQSVFPEKVTVVTDLQHIVQYIL